METVRVEVVHDGVSVELMVLGPGEVEYYLSPEQPGGYGEVTFVWFQYHARDVFIVSSQSFRHSDLAHELLRLCKQDPLTMGGATLGNHRSGEVGISQNYSQGLRAGISEDSLSRGVRVLNDWLVDYRAREAG